jgi:hypothetical protein
LERRAGIFGGREPMNRKIRVKYPVPSEEELVQQALGSKVLSPRQYLKKYKRDEEGRIKEQHLKIEKSKELIKRMKAVIKNIEKARKRIG